MTKRDFGIDIGKAVGNIMPVTINGTTLKVPLTLKRRGQKCDEVGFSRKKSISQSTVKQLKRVGFPAFTKKFGSGKKAIHVVYRCRVKGRNR